MTKSWRDDYLLLSYVSGHGSFNELNQHPFVAQGMRGGGKGKMADLTRAKSIDPDYAEAHINIGVAYGKSGKYKEAIESFNQALMIDPDYAFAHYNLGIAYDESGKVEKAIGSYKQAIK